MNFQWVKLNVSNYRNIIKQWLQHEQWCKLKHLYSKSIKTSQSLTNYIHFISFTFVLQLDKTHKKPIRPDFSVDSVLFLSLLFQQQVRLLLRFRVVHSRLQPLRQYIASVWLQAIGNLFMQILNQVDFETRY